MQRYYNADSILHYIQFYMANHGYAPSMRDIQAEFRISSLSVVRYHLQRLEERGKIKRDPLVARGLRLVKEA